MSTSFWLKQQSTLKSFYESNHLQNDNKQYLILKATLHKNICWIVLGPSHCIALKLRQEWFCGLGQLVPSEAILENPILRTKAMSYPIIEW